MSIYLSSEGDGDTGVERDVIRTEVAPLLRQLCRSRNLHFELIDLQPTARQLRLVPDTFSDLPASFRHRIIRGCFLHGVGPSYLVGPNGLPLFSSACSNCEQKVGIEVTPVFALLCTYLMMLRLLFKRKWNELLLCA